MPAAAILGAAAVGAVGSAVAAGKNSKAIGQATDAQLQATRESNALAREIRDENRGILNPFVQQGYKATNALEGLLYGNDGGASTAALREAPGYQFRYDEGMRGLNASFAAQGLGNSGAAAKAAIRYGQNFGSNEYNNRFNQLASQQGVGLTAGNALAGVGSQYAGQVMSNNANAADAIGRGAVAQASNTSALIGSLSNIAGTVGSYYSSYGPSGVGNAGYGPPGYGAGFGGWGR